MGCRGEVCRGRDTIECDKVVTVLESSFFWQVIYADNILSLTSLAVFVLTNGVSSNDLISVYDFI